MASRVQELCIPLGNVEFISAGAATEISEGLKTFRDADRYDVAEFRHYRKTSGTIDGDLVQFDLLLRVAGNRLVGGRFCPDAFTAILCVGGAMPARDQKFLVLAST